MLHAHGGRTSIVAVASLLIVAAGSGAAFAAESTQVTTNVTVTQDNLQKWAQLAYDDTTALKSNQQFVAGPGTPPLGGGSLEMSLSSAENDKRVEVFHTGQYDGTEVANLKTLTYSTYSRATAGNSTPQQPAYLRLSVDSDGVNGADDTLTFYPDKNPVPAPPAQDKWQTWDAGADTASWIQDDGSPTTLVAYRAAHPAATIAASTAGPVSSPVGGIAFMVGGSGPSTPQMDGEYFLNIIRIGKDDPAASVESITRYDLEPPQPKVSVGDAQVVEGNSGASLKFPVTVANPTARAVTLEYNTVRGTALPGSDYKAAWSKVTIAAGQTTGEIVVQVISDTVNEPTETMSVVATAPGYGTMSDGTAIGTILDDDPVVLPPVVLPPVVTPPATVVVSADLVVKGVGHQAGKDDIVANAIRKAAGAKVKLLRKTASGSFRKIASGVLNSKGNHRFKNIVDENGNKPTTYKVKISRTDLTERDKGRVRLR